jgi:UDP-2,4-diacetamido-2,4,6-trideoxy-beta-L-altropyranose hydrolase
MNVLIRCDSSNIIGTGHVMRMLNLCEYYPEYKFTFLCRNFKTNITNKIIEKNHSLIKLDYTVEPELNNYRTWIGKDYNEEIKEFKNIVVTNKFDLIIIDHYGIDYLLEKEIIDYCDKLFVITDIFDYNHHCNIFINYSSEDIERNKKINLNPNTVYKIGYNNIILNKKFIISDKKSIFNETLKKIVINMGGSDPPNYTLKILKVINDYVISNNIQVFIIIGKSNINIQSIKDFIGSKINFNLLFDLNYDDLIKLYLDCDLTIGTLSVTAFERLVLKIPQVCLKIVENQLIQQLNEFNIVKLENLLDKIKDFGSVYKSIKSNDTGVPNTMSLLTFLPNMSQ